MSPSFWKIYKPPANVIIAFVVHIRSVTLAIDLYTDGFIKRICNAADKNELKKIIRVMNEKKIRYGLENGWFKIDDVISCGDRMSERFIEDHIGQIDDFVAVFQYGRLSVDFLRKYIDICEGFWTTICKYQTLTLDFIIEHLLDEPLLIKSCQLSITEWIWLMNYLHVKNLGLKTESAKSKALIDAKTTGHSMNEFKDWVFAHDGDMNIIDVMSESESFDNTCTYDEAVNEITQMWANDCAEGILSDIIDSDEWSEDDL
jgi:hypothetical protein